MERFLFLQDLFTKSLWKSNQIQPREGFSESLINSYLRIRLQTELTVSKKLKITFLYYNYKSNTNLLKKFNH